MLAVVLLPIQGAVVGSEIGLAASGRLDPLVGLTLAGFSFGCLVATAISFARCA